MDGLGDIWVVGVGIGELRLAPKGQVTEDGILQWRGGIRVGEVLFQFLKVALPKCRSILPSAGENMRGGLRLATAGAVVISLIFPSD